MVKIVSKHSLARMHESLASYNVPKDYAHPIVNYLIHGLYPGGFFTSLLANDAIGAINRSHPSNDMLGLKNLVTWIQNKLVNGVHYGSYEIVDEWTMLPTETKRKSLEDRNLIFDEQTEIMMILKDEPTAYV
jgi:hypothetical protein